MCATGQAQTTVAGKARAVRYVEKMVLNVELRNASSGEIYPPFLDITYSSATLADFKENKKVQVSFEVVYSMSSAKYRRDLSISAGVLSSLAVIYTVLQTWGWSKRAGKVAIDFVTIVKFLLFFCGNLASMFFLILCGISIWWLIFFKKQSTVTILLPTVVQEKEFISYLISAFVLKSLHLFHMIATQVTVDVFLIDWERPHGKAAQATDIKVDSGRPNPVSIWRTCFVANEWNEIQTVRKINNVIQIFTVIFFLHVVGFENIASRDPHSDFTVSEDEYHAPSSRILRVAVASSVYLCVALVQWLFYTLVYQRFIEDPVRQFVDLCSVTNISVFVLENSLYGYYIHGRSVHGCADTGMHEMMDNLKREEEDLCGQRGLLPGTEQQTFQISIPRTLRSQFDRILQPMSAPQHGAVAHGGGNAPGHLNIITEKSVHAYMTLNRLLQGFIDHVSHLPLLFQLGASVMW
ncbi:Meckelin [Lamellibrachia satsuma]|nr:Meckelin [Lamellibrachia satsuma]